MTQKILAFIITFLFLAGAIWWANNNKFSLLKFNQSLDQENISNINNSNNMTQKQWPNPPDLAIDQNKTYEATIKTSKGNMVFELFSNETPNTVNNFIFLANEDFYQNTTFHRIVKNFMVQGGDPTGTGTGGPGYKFADEPITRDYTRGVLAMANSGADTNGSQFFIMHADVDLPPKYVIFGRLLSGLDTLDTIANTPTTDNGSGEKSKPLETIIINDIIISEK